MGKQLTVLMLEDSEDDAGFLEREISRGGFDLRTVRVSSENAYRDALAEGPWDVVIADFNLPGFNGREAFHLYQKADLDCPFILVSGLVDPSVAAELMAAGTHDFIEKGDLSRLVPAIVRELRSASIRQELVAANAALRSSEARFRDLVEGSLQGIIAHDGEMLLFANRASAEMFGYESAADQIGRPFVDHIAPEHRDLVRRMAQGRLQDEGVPDQYEFKGLRKDGSTIWLEARARLVEWDGRKVFQAAIIDITHRKQAEASLQESRRQLAALINGIPSMAWLKDRDHRYIAANEAYAKSAGLTVEQLVGRATVDVWPKEQAERFVAFDSNVMETRTRKRTETAMPLANGSSRWDEVIVSPVFDGSGNVVGTAGVAQDITERVGAENTLRKLSAAVEQSPVAIAMTNSDQKIEYANPQFFTLTGFERDEVLGQTLAFLEVSPDSEDTKTINDVMAVRKQWRGEIQAQRKNGEHFWSSWHVAPVADEAGRVTDFLNIAEDTTEHRRLEDHLRRAQRMEAVGTLAGGISHDFNNILTGVIGHCQIAIEKTGPESKIGFNLEQILNAARRARDLVQQLLTFSGRREPVLKTVALHKVVDEAVRLVYASIPPNITVHWRVSVDAGTVRADPTQIHQILLNLCKNAVDAIGNATGTIGVEVDKTHVMSARKVSGEQLPAGHYAVLRVSDTGCGMDDYTLGRIFDPFFTTKEVGAGTGLGLAAVSGIVRDHGGGIEIESEVGKGSVFTVLLPCVEEQVTAGQAIAPEDVHGTERILLVDDERMIVQSLGYYLELQGYQVEALTSGPSALAVFETKPDQFDIVITDQVMPDMPGDVLAGRIHTARPDLPIILCTGYAAPLSAEVIDRMGVSAVVRKPVEPGQLALVVRHLLDEKA